MIGTNDISRVQSATAYDNSGSKVGKVDQIYLDDQTGEPNWLTVNTGMFGTSTSFVPLEGASFDGDNLRLAYDKDRIKDAPRIEVDQHLEREQEDELYRYYGLSYGGQGYDTTQTTTDTTQTTGYADTGVRTGSADEAAVTLSEERLQVGTQAQEAGRARLRKYTTSETETVSVPVSKEKLVVERSPASGQTTTGAIADTDQVEEITLREERPVVAKETVAVEEVRVGKEQVTEQHQVSDEVRREHVEIEGEGTTGVEGQSGYTR
jgi:uncharacterized protein (TIGR02271 family)